MKRIEWLDGIKGFACMAVMWHHFAVGFLPASFYGSGGEISLIHTENGWDAALAQSPLLFWLNGNYMVALFCVISGLVLGLQVMLLNEKNKLSQIVSKRYIRLMLPVAPIVFIVYLLMKFELFFNVEAAAITQSEWLRSYYLEKASLYQCLKSLFVTIWFLGDHTFSNAFWMLNILFFGSMISILLGCMAWQANKRIVFAYLFVALIFVALGSFEFAFVLGVLLAFCFKEWKDFVHHPIVGGICLLLGLFLGSYPSGVIPDNIYKYLAISRFGIGFQFWHIIGAALTIYGIWNIGWLQKGLTKKIFCFLGKISYSVFIIHIPIIFSVSTKIFLILSEKNASYLTNVLITFVITNIIVVLLSYLYFRYVEYICNKLTEYFVSLFLTTSKKTSPR